MVAAERAETVAWEAVGVVAWGEARVVGLHQGASEQRCSGGLDSAWQCYLRS